MEQLCGKDWLFSRIGTVLSFRQQCLLWKVKCCHIPKPVMCWSNNANVELRKGVMANQAWLLEQTDGKLYNTLHEVFGQLLDTDLLHDGLFLTSRTRNMATWTDEGIAAEDTLATLAGRMATRFVMHRSRCTRYLWGLPRTWGYLFATSPAFLLLRSAVALLSYSR